MAVPRQLISLVIKNPANKQDFHLQIKLKYTVARLKKKLHKGERGCLGPFFFRAMGPSSERARVRPSVAFGLRGGGQRYNGRGQLSVCLKWRGAGF